MSDALSSNVDVSNLCRNFYVSRLRAAERLRAKMGAGRGTRGRGAATATVRPFQVLDMLRTDLAAMMDSDLQLVRQLLLLNEQLDELRRDQAAALQLTSPLPPISGSITTADLEGSDTEMSFTPFSPCATAPPGLGGERGPLYAAYLAAGNNREPLAAPPGALSKYQTQSVLSLLRASHSDRLPSEDFLRDVERPNYDDDVFQAGGGTAIKIVLERANVDESQAAVTSPWNAAQCGNGVTSLGGVSQAQDLVTSLERRTQDQNTVTSVLNVVQDLDGAMSRVDEFEDDASVTPMIGQGQSLNIMLADAGQAGLDSDKAISRVGVQFGLVTKGNDELQVSNALKSNTLPVRFRMNQREIPETSTVSIDAQDGLLGILKSNETQANTYTTINLDRNADSFSSSRQASAAMPFFTATFQTQTVACNEPTEPRYSENIVVAKSSPSNSRSFLRRNSGLANVKSNSDAASQNSESNSLRKSLTPAADFDECKTKPVSEVQTKVLMEASPKSPPKVLPKRSAEPSPAKSASDTTTWPRKKYPACTQQSTSASGTATQPNVRKTSAVVDKPIAVTAEEEKEETMATMAPALVQGQNTIEIAKIKSKFETVEADLKSTPKKREQQFENTKQQWQVSQTRQQVSVSEAHVTSAAGLQMKLETQREKPAVSPKTMKVTRSNTFTSVAEVGQARNMMRSLRPIKEQPTIALDAQPTIALEAQPTMALDAQDAMMGDEQVKVVAMDGEGRLIFSQKTTPVNSVGLNSTTMQRTKSAAERRSPERQTWIKRNMATTEQQVSATINTSRQQAIGLRSTNQHRISADVQEKMKQRVASTKVETSIKEAIGYSSQTEQGIKLRPSESGVTGTVVTGKDFDAKEAGTKPVRRVLSLRTTSGSAAAGFIKGVDKSNKTEGGDKLDGRPQTPAKVLVANKAASFDDPEKFITIHF